MEQWRTPRGRKIYTFLRKDPKAAKVRAFSDDRDWVVIVTTPREVCAAVIDAQKLEALDGGGAVLRVLDISDDEPDQPERSRSSDILAIDLPRLIDNLGRNMREIAGEAAKQQAGAFKSGFDAMGDVVKLCLAMLERVDQRLADEEQREPQVIVQQGEPAAGSGPERSELARMAIMKALGQSVDPGGGVNQQQVTQLQQLFEQYLASQMGGASNPEPNGHAG